MGSKKNSLPFLVTNIPVGKDGKANLDVKRAKQVHESVKDVRGKVIEAALFVEAGLTRTILHYLVGKQYPVQGKLREFIFDAEFCTFMQKRKMLSQIFEIDGKSIACMNVEEAKALRRSVNEIITVRDKFAHGEIVVEGQSYTASIKYYSGGTKEEPVTNDIFEEFEAQCIRAGESLGMLTDYFRDNHESATSPHLE